MTDDAEIGEADPESVARAEAIVESMRGKFLDWLKTTETALKEHLTALESDAGTVDANARQAVVEAVTVIAHEMRGLGAPSAIRWLREWGRRWRIISCSGRMRRRRTSR